jgi:hypothetical protein
MSRDAIEAGYGLDVVLAVLVIDEDSPSSFEDQGSFCLESPKVAEPEQDRVIAIVAALDLYVHGGRLLLRSGRLKKLFPRTAKSMRISYAPG